MNKQKLTHIALDGNEANIINRVGSNVYAFEILSALEKITRNQPNLQFSVLLRSTPIADLPAARAGWEYQIFGPTKLWTQWALPLHLFRHRQKYDVLFSPGHYAPQLCPIPYVSSVMDTAYLEYPEHFQQKDLLQLTKWTQKAVKHAAKVVAISEQTKKSIIKHYGRSPDDVKVAYPAFTGQNLALNLQETKEFFKNHSISQPYLLFVGTLQPRKNIITLIEAFEIFSRMVAGRALKSRRSKRKAAQLKPAKLVLAGKVGWLADDILERIESSPVKKRIIRTGFISEAEKGTLYKNAFASILVGLYEGFGIPPLESLAWQTPPIVSNTSSLPEVVGKAGLTADPLNPQQIAEQIWKAYTLSSSQKAALRRRGREQLKKFSWEKSAAIILDTLENVAHQRS